MKRFRVRAFSTLLGAAVLLAAATLSLSMGARAQAAGAYQPQVGQPGKDVVWVPTPDRLIVRMLQLADTTREDVLVDLGSGDGRIPIAAARKFGARAIGVEFDPALVEYSMRSAEREGVASQVKFVRQDLFLFDLSIATVVALYVSPAVMMQLRPKLLELKPGTRVVSHQFTLGDWEPDESVRVEGVPGYLWVVPAKAGGSWVLTLGDRQYVLRLQQEYQLLRGTAEREGRSSPVIAARLRGDEARFTFVDSDGYAWAFSGRVAGDVMQGSARAYERPDLKWIAKRGK